MLDIIRIYAIVGLETMFQGGERMSEKEKTIIERISQMPDAVKEKFLNMAEGAAIALESVKEEKHDGKSD